MTTWSLFGGVQPYVTIDQWAIDNIADPHAHLRRAPADGTVVEGLPSHAFWQFSGGLRHTAVATAGAVTEDDAGLAAFPLYVAPTPDTVGPTTFTKAASGRKGRAIRLYYRVTDAVSANAQAVRLVVKDARGAIVKGFTPGTCTMSAWHSVRWTPRARGTFRYYVYAKDMAGNAQVMRGSAKVIVK